MHHRAHALLYHQRMQRRGVTHITHMAAHRPPQRRRHARPHRRGAGGKIVEADQPIARGIQRQAGLRAAIAGIAGDQHGGQ
jgi:hypothetical protein